MKDKIRRGVLALAMTIGLTVGIGIVTAAPAAAEGSYNVLYTVEASEVCRHQGHFGATSFRRGRQSTTANYNKRL